MKYTYHMIVDKNETSRTHDSLETCMNELMSHLFNTLGDGDGENGGEGSLWRCAKEIYDSIASGTTYTYANCSFYITKENDDENDKDRNFVFRFSAVVDNSINLSAKTYEEALRKYNTYKNDFVKDLERCVNKSLMGWDYDGNINDEGNEEL